MSKKIWKIKGKREKYTDEEIIKLIKQGILTGNFFITTNEMRNWIKIKDSIYQFYLNGGNN